MMKVNVIKERGIYDIGVSSEEKNVEKDLMALVVDTKGQTYDIVFDDVVANEETRKAYEYLASIANSVAKNRKDNELHGEVKTYSKEILDKFLSESGIVPISEEENRIIEMHNEQLSAYNKGVEDSYYAFK